MHRGEWREVEPQSEARGSALRALRGLRALAATVCAVLAIAAIGIVATAAAFVRVPFALLALLASWVMGTVRVRGPEGRRSRSESGS
jgi:uncharacterized membrane protein YdbT with pleckstrin-like domain